MPSGKYIFRPTRAELGPSSLLTYFPVAFLSTATAVSEVDPISTGFLFFSFLALVWGMKVAVTRSRSHQRREFLFPTHHLTSLELQPKVMIVIHGGCGAVSPTFELH